MAGYCWNDYEHESDARRDVRRGSPNRDEYDRYHESSDPCREAYTEEYNREIRRIELRQEEEREDRRANERMAARRQQEQAEEEYYYAQQAEEPQPPEPEEEA